MVNRNNGESQKQKVAKEILEKMAPQVKSMIEGYDPGQNQDIVDIQNISDLTIDDFYNPKMNASFYAHNDEHFVMDNDGKVGFVCSVLDFDENKVGDYTFVRESLGKAFEDYNTTLLALIAEIQDQFFEFKISAVINAFFMQWRKKLSNEKLEEIDARADKLFYEKIKGTKGLDAVIQAIDSLEQ